MQSLYRELSSLLRVVGSSSELVEALTIGADEDPLISGGEAAAAADGAAGPSNGGRGWGGDGGGGSGGGAGSSRSMMDALQRLNVQCNVSFFGGGSRRGRTR